MRSKNYLLASLLLSIIPTSCFSAEIFIIVALVQRSIINISQLKDMLLSAIEFFCVIARRVKYGCIGLFFTVSRMATSAFGNSSSTTTTDNNTMSAEERMAVEAAEANTALETARTADAIEEQETRMTQEARNRLVEKSRDILNTYRNAVGNDISECVKDRLLLDKAKAFVRDEENGQIVYLTKRKEELEVYHKELDKGIQKLTAFVKSAEEEKSSKKEVNVPVDELAVPGDIHSAQMLILSAENAANNDALYFLDNALANHRISLHDHLIAVRKLTKTQFLVKAHLLKIGQVKASEAITQNAWS